jgi:hypothetical protein
MSCRQLTDRAWRGFFAEGEQPEPELLKLLDSQRWKAVLAYDVCLNQHNRYKFY